MNRYLRYMFPIVALILAALALYAVAHAASYVQPLSCTATGIALNSPTTSATVQCPNVPPPPQGCQVVPGISPTGAAMNYTRAVGYVSVGYFGYGAATRDITSWPSVFDIPGYAIKPWPAYYNAPPVFNLRTNNYAALQFTVPKPYFSASNVPVGLFGNEQIGQSSWTVPVSMTIARACGDFGQVVPTTIPAGCSINMGGANSFVTWSNIAGRCNLIDGVTYYLNIIEADISSFPAKSTAKTSLCPNGYCGTPLVNGFGNWNHYIPQQ
jgi:hypothetical protein